jgi:hypothetical protein
MVMALVVLVEQVVQCLHIRVKRVWRVRVV